MALVLWKELTLMTQLLMLDPRRTCALEGLVSQDAGIPHTIVDDHHVRSHDRTQKPSCSSKLWDSIDAHAAEIIGSSLSASRSESRCSGLETQQLFSQTGFATFLVSVSPVIGSLNSLQLIGYMVLSVSLFAMITPSSFRAVVR